MLQFSLLFLIKKESPFYIYQRREGIYSIFLLRFSVNCCRVCVPTELISQLLRVIVIMNATTIFRPDVSILDQWL